MKDMKLSNIQKESEKIKIKKNINECEDLKAQILLKLGIMTFDKIRKGEITDTDFDTLCDDIKNLDIEIYTKYIQLRELENKSKKTTCQCGYVAFKNEKFCPQCGKSLIEEEKTYITCQNCNQETEIDSNFCACCGSRIKQELTYYEDEVYCMDNNLKLEECVIEEETENTDTAKKDFKSDVTDINDDKLEEELIEIEGREFLKKHQNHI